MPQCELDISASPYFAKEPFDRELKKTRKIARQLGIKVSAPPPFAASSQHYQGMRVLRAPQKCHE
jgi:hypothetical protein